jgi:hypothetical protein
MWYYIIFGRLTTVDREITARCNALNRADPDMLEYMQYNIDHCDPSKGETYMVNLLRILGAVKNKKASCHFVTRPTQVILPLSPNHGFFGNDGLYSESKISLETLFQRWASESWGEYLCLAGAVIGCVCFEQTRFFIDISYLDGRVEQV